jgi:isopenicillin N synthase-like dioxygenase
MLRVLRGMALTLELPEDYFDGFSDTPDAALAALSHPVGEAVAGREGLRGFFF